MSGTRPTVRVGVIGCGSIARYAHLRLLPGIEGAALVAAADPEPEAREAARRLSGVETHAEAAELLERDDVDAVVIAAPTPALAGLACRAAGSGRHVYVEKPLAADPREAAGVAEAAAEAGVAGAVGYTRRHHPLYRHARALLGDGAIGPVRAVVTAFCEPAAAGIPAWKRSRATGGGALLDLASHHVDLVRWFLGEEIVEVTASVASGESEDDAARLSLVTAGGVGVQGTFSFRAGHADFLEFVGEAGTLRVDRHRPALELRVPRRRGYGIRRSRPVPPAEVLVWRATRFFRRVREPSYRAALSAFVRAAAGADRGDLATLEDGVRTLEVLAAAGTAAREGRPVTVGGACASS